MKNFFLICLTTIFLFGFEVFKKESVEIEIKTAKIESFLNASIFNKNLFFVINHISDLKNKFCKINNYNIYPFYSYEKKKKIFKGYKANVNIHCVFDENNLDRFTDYVNKISEFSKVSINKIGFLEDKNEKNRIFKIKAYERANLFAKNLSKKLNKKCYLKNINFYHNTDIYPVKSKVRVLSLPVPQNNIYKLNFSYTVECL